MQRFSPFVKTARSGSYLPDTEVIRSFIASSRALMTRMTRIAKNGACCTRNEKRLSSTGITTLSRIARTVALLGCSLINAISPTIPPAGTLSK